MQQEVDRQNEQLRNYESGRVNAEQELRVSFETECASRFQRIQQMHEEELGQLKNQLLVLSTL